MPPVCARFLLGGTCHKVLPCLRFPYLMKASHIFGYSVAVLLPAWASYVFFRGSITGAPPMYSRGWLERILHFIAGIIFGALTIAACLKLAGR
jgi:hypothetical protein